MLTRVFFLCDNYVTGLCIVPQVAMLVSADGTLLRSQASGQVKMKALLSGMPDCKLGLNDHLALLNKSKTDTATNKNDTRRGRRNSLPMSDAATVDSKGNPRTQVDVEDCTFHKCVRLGKFDADRSISFVPPDGEFELMRYRDTQNIHLPFKVLAVVEEVSWPVFISF